MPGCGQRAAQAVIAESGSPGALPRCDLAEWTEYPGPICPNPADTTATCVPSYGSSYLPLGTQPPTVYVDYFADDVTRQTAGQE
jgi:hypothetical protein